MHTGLLILLWMGFIALLQHLPLAWLALVVLLCALAVAGMARARGIRLVRRVRYLLLAIVILFCGFTPGEALLADWPALSPSREGVRLAAEHAGRILAAVLCVALLMERLPPDRLVSGIYALLRPFGALGLSPARVAVRLLLVLRLVEEGAPRRWQAWLEEEAGGGAGEAVHIVRERMGWRDALAVALFAAAALAVLWGLG